MKKTVKRVFKKISNVISFIKNKTIELENIKQLEIWAKKQEGYKFYDLVPEHGVGVFTVVNKKGIKTAHVPQRELVINRTPKETKHKVPKKLGILNHQQDIAGFVHVGNVMEDFNKAVLCCIPQMRHNIEAGNNIIRIPMDNGQTVASLEKDNDRLSPIILRGDLSSGFNSVEHEIKERVEINLLDFFRAYEEDKTGENNLIGLLETAIDNLALKVISAEKVFSDKLSPCVFFEISREVIPFIRDGKAGLVAYSLFYVIGGFVSDSSSEDKE